MKQKVKIIIVEVLSMILKFVVGSHIIMFLTDKNEVAQKLHGRRYEIEKMLSLSAMAFTESKLQEIAGAFKSFNKKNAKPVH